MFLRAFKQRVSIVQGTERLFKPSDAMVIEIVCGVVSRQYPSLMPTLYPGRLMATPQPFNEVLEMWAAFEVLATNKTRLSVGFGSVLSPPADTSRTPPRHQPQHNRRAPVAAAPTPKVLPSPS